jgi:hypothetical protein
MTSSGIFERNVRIEIPGSGPRSWRVWKTKIWRGLSGKPSWLNIDMRNFPKDRKNFRVVMDHGDNRPLEISKFEIGYPEKALMFIATSPGSIQIFGGNPEAAPGAYDIDLVRHHLTGVKPEIVELAEIHPYGESRWKLNLKRIFGDQGWGLYIVLGVISLFLLLIIVKLFPKSKIRTD